MTATSPLELTVDERAQLVKILERESYRLRSLDEEYRKATKSKNAVIHAMCEEGASGVKQRIVELDRMIARARGEQIPKGNTPATLGRNDR